MGIRTNRVLTIVFAGLLAVNFTYLLLGFLSIPSYYNRVTSLTIQPPNLPGAINPTNESVQQIAADQGMTLSQYATVQIVFHSAMVLLFIAVAVVIVSRARWNWFAWYSACVLVFIAEFAFYNEVYVARLLPLWIYEAGALFWPLVLLYFFLFPNGKPVPSRALWVVGSALPFHFIIQLSGFLLILIPDLAAQLTFEKVIGPAQVVIVGVLLFILGCQVYRYVCVSTQEEKQQTKWFLLGFLYFLVLAIVSEALGDKNPFRAEVGLLIFTFIPLSIGVAVLHYHLWDIDLIIRRTLQYTILTSLLGLIYFGGVALLQIVLSTIGSQSSAVVIVATTLAIAALFNPLRRRIQDFIDRRFYRQKYNAEKALAEFAAAARSETDLTQLSSRLTRTVQETLQPEQISLWIVRNR